MVHMMHDIYCTSFNMLKNCEGGHASILTFSPYLYFKRTCCSGILSVATSSSKTNLGARNAICLVNEQFV